MRSGSGRATQCAVSRKGTLVTRTSQKWSFEVAAAKARSVAQTVSSLQPRFCACSECPQCGPQPQHHEGRAKVWKGPNAAQRDLYKTAHEQVQHNMPILKPHMSFRDYANAAWDIPGKYNARRYYLSVHGSGMTGEYPYLYHHGDFPDAGYDGEILPGMTLCVESVIGAEAGEGAKLEQQVLITETDVELLSEFPFEAALMA
ncbi:M24 family metallopeptidase [Aquicoccus porphyridii]|uniref:M24 family metallopeptidase n=1 Tax=Aquicoccus porphyridii TaxID=1852029 RepID=UPI00319E7F5C